MSFASGAYLLFLPAVTALYWLCPGKYRYLLLLAASYGFYMGWSAPLALLLLGETAVCYASCLIVEKKKSKGLFACLLLLIFAPLLICKYPSRMLLGLFPGNLYGWLKAAALPVGISFYTFQAASCVMDVYRGDQQPERNFFRFALFVSFFPQLVAGPIERGKDLLPQLWEEKHFLRSDVAAGGRLLLSGFFRKICVADFIAPYVDSVFSVQQPDGFSAALGAVLFGFQIYNDFAGYSEIALGSARLLGIRLTRNFREPYLSLTLRDFWRRWHITLNGWFRSYVYLPLGGKNRRLLAVSAVFLLSGLWHGADVTFLLWGAVHGMCYLLENAVTRKRGRPLPGWLSFPFTFAVVSLSWIFFRAADLSKAWEMYGALFSPWHWGAGWQQSGLTLIALFRLLLALAVSFFAGRWAFDSKPPVNRDLALAVLLALAIALCWLFNLRSGGANAFIYFQF